MIDHRDQLSVALIAQLVEHCRDHLFESYSGLNFLQALISKLTRLCITTMIKHAILLKRSVSVVNCIPLTTTLCREFDLMKILFIECQVVRFSVLQLILVVINEPGISIAENTNVMIATPECYTVG